MWLRNNKMPRCIQDILTRSGSYQRYTWSSRLPGSIAPYPFRILAEYRDYSSNEDVLALWTDIKRLCAVGVLTNYDPERLQRDADFRFVKVYQCHNESVTTLRSLPSRKKVVRSWKRICWRIVDHGRWWRGRIDPKFRAIRSRILIKSKGKRLWIS